MHGRPPCLEFCLQSSHTLEIGLWAGPVSMPAAWGHDCITVSKVFCFGFMLLALLRKVLALMIARKKIILKTETKCSLWQERWPPSSGMWQETGMQQRRLCAVHPSCVIKFPLAPRRSTGGHPVCACYALGPKRTVPLQWSCHFPCPWHSGLHHGAVLSAWAGYLLNETKPQDVLQSSCTSSTLAANGCSDGNYFEQSSGEHEWVSQQPGKFHAQKGPALCRYRCPLMVCWTSLELGQTKSPLKYVWGEGQILNTRGFALQTVSSLSTAFVYWSTTSDATSSPSLQVPTPSQLFPVWETSRGDMGDPALQKIRASQKEPNQVLRNGKNLSNRWSYHYNRAGNKPWTHSIRS